MTYKEKKGEVLDYFIEVALPKEVSEAEPGTFYHRIREAVINSFSTGF